MLVRDAGECGLENDCMLLAFYEEEIGALLSAATAFASACRSGERAIREVHAALRTILWPAGVDLLHHERPLPHSGGDTSGRKLYLPMRR